MLQSPRGGRVLLWLSALVLVAGVIAFTTARLGSSAAPPTVSGPDQPIDAQPTTANVSEVPKEAREAAAAFILSAVSRDDLPKAWKLTHSDLKAQCACTYKQWLSGNIPIQPFPIESLDGVTYAVDELKKDRVVLLVLLTAKKGAEPGEGIFYIGLKPEGSGKDRKWLVDYWAPKVGVPVPADFQ